jgi:hypothetical protein
MSYVFISYCRENQDTVKVLAQDIGGLGHKVWLDQELAGGQAWWDQILAVIRECDVFLFALAPKSLDSAACKREYKYASALGKTVLPVLVADGVSVNLLPPELSRIQHVDYRRQDKRAAIDVLKALSDLPKVPPLPDPLPEPPSPPLSYLGGLMEQIQVAGELTFAEQAALVLKLKEGLDEAEHREEVCTLLTRLKKRDDLYARIGMEIDGLLASCARVQPNSRPSATREKPSSNISALAEEAAPRSKWRSILRGALALFKGALALLGGAVVAGVSIGGMKEAGLLKSRAEEDVAGFLLWPVCVVVIVVIWRLTRRWRGTLQKTRRPSA